MPYYVTFYSNVLSKCIEKMLMILILFLWKIENVIIQGTEMDNSEEDSSEEGNVDRIFGGFALSVERAPYYVQIVNRTHFKCGGSILSQQVVLTSGHCTYKRGPYFVIAGSIRKLFGTKLGVKKVLTHPSFGIKPQHYNDVGLIFLEKALTFTTQVQPVRIPSFETSLVKEGTNLLVIGFGMIFDFIKVPHLQGLYLPMIKEKTCHEFLTNKSSDPMFLPTQFCLGYLTVEGQGSCDGHSGSPAVYNGMQFGVVSYGFGCKRKEAVKVYANLVPLSKWIRKQVKDLEFRMA